MRIALLLASLLLLAAVPAQADVQHTLKVTIIIQGGGNGGNGTLPEFCVHGGGMSCFVCVGLAPSDDFYIDPLRDGVGIGAGANDDGANMHAGMGTQTCPKSIT